MSDILMVWWACQTIGSAGILHLVCGDLAHGVQYSIRVYPASSGFRCVLNCISFACRLPADTIIWIGDYAGLLMATWGTVFSSLDPSFP